MMIDAPVSTCARAPALSTLRSFPHSGHEQPSSPITPAFTPLWPVVMSDTISAAISSSDIASIPSGWDAPT